MKKGRVTIPTNLDVVPQTLEMLDEWGADAIRDCDGTEFPQELKETGAKIYATYYTTRKDNAWAKANPEEIQQMYIMTSFHTATSDKLEIHLMDHLYPDMLLSSSTLQESSSLTLSQEPATKGCNKKYGRPEKNHWLRPLTGELRLC